MHFYLTFMCTNLLVCITAEEKLSNSLENTQLVFVVNPWFHENMKFIHKLPLVFLAD